MISVCQDHTYIENNDKCKNSRYIPITVSYLLFLLFMNFEIQSSENCTFSISENAYCLISSIW